MYEDTTAEDTRVGTECLWVVIEVRGQSVCFELDGQLRHSIAIGTSPCADLRVEHELRVPIECNLTRDHDEVWLIPGWPTNLIRVDGALINKPVRLWRRCRVEIEGISFGVRVREEPPTCPDCASLDADVSSSTAATVVPRRQSAEAASERCWTDASDTAPSSTAAVVRSLPWQLATSTGTLERLGALTKRRPVCVSLAAGLGALVMSASMHFGVHALQRMLERRNAFEPQAVALFTHIPRRCTRTWSATDSNGSLEHEVTCDPAYAWVHRVWPELADRTHAFACYRTPTSGAASSR
jgi:hypothetical protein